MKTHTRCQHCRARRALPKHPDEYQILPKCRVCGRRGYTVDKYRQAGKDVSITCHRDCCHYPHRLGSSVCAMNTDGSYKEPEE